MARQHIFSLPSSVFLIFLLASELETTQAASGANQVEVVVEGMVYCQSCDGVESLSLTGATPISMANVSVACRDYRNQSNYNQVFTTDRKGYFYAELKGYKVNHYYLDHPLQSCKVSLVSSPNPHCKKITKVNSDTNGALLRYENKRLRGKYYEAVIYAAGPLAFQPNNCTQN